MGTPQQDQWMQEVLQVPKEHFNLPAVAPAPAAKAPSAAEKAKAVAANALKLLKQAQDSYRETKAAAASSFAAGLDDPGAKIEALAKTATKGASDAAALLKQGEAAHALKAADAAETAARDAGRLVTDYAVAIDHAAVTKPAQSASTPWGTIALPMETSGQIANFIVPMSKAYEVDKTEGAQFQTMLEEQRKAVMAVMAYLTAPEKASAEVTQFASAKAVDKAEQSDTAKLLKDFVSHYHKMLQVLLSTAQDRLTSAQKQVKALDLKGEAKEKREEAERASKLIDTLIDGVMSASKIVIGGVEEVPGAAAEIIVGLIKTYKTSDLLNEAAKLQAEAESLEHEAITIDVASAGKCIGEVNDLLTELEPLAGGAAEGADRKVIRAAKQFDADCDKDPRGKACKFRFHLVTRAQEATKRSVDAADSHCRMWMGADVCRGMTVKALDDANQYWFGDSRKTLDAAQRDIQAHLTECQATLKEVQEIGSRLDMLFNNAMTALTHAQQG